MLVHWPAGLFGAVVISCTEVLLPLAATADGSARHLTLAVKHLDGRAPRKPAREAEHLVELGDAGVERQHGEQHSRARRRKRGGVVGFTTWNAGGRDA